MRLLHTENLEFSEFFDSNIPTYAILSHRWEEDEISYQRFLDTKIEERTGSSFSKILQCCVLARSDGLQWVWIDTCCIDKRSSAELSEAMNAMFTWYQQSEICYAYLSDCDNSLEESGYPGPSQYFAEASRTAPLYSDFQDSKWFTRGWTLQELLAPRDVLFYDRNWLCIGAKSQFVCTKTQLIGRNHQQSRSLAASIAAATGIPEKILHRQDAIEWASVAMKMSWLSRRTTSRTEDMAYCMLGLFDVNMPLLYGEGTKAFLRLQLEIIKKSDDESIFAWACKGFLDPSWNGLLAQSPSHFANSGDIQCYSSRIEQRPPYVMTNKGLELRIPESAIFPNIHDRKMISLTLSCYKTTNFDRNWRHEIVSGFSSDLWIELVQSQEDHRWTRAEPGQIPGEDFFFQNDPDPLVVIYVRQAGL